MITAKSIDATSGPLVRQMILYSIPLILSSLLQTLFNAVDTAVLGNMADSGAVASVGATGSVVRLIIYAFLGISDGTRIVLARFVGEKSPEKIRATVDTSVMLAAGFGLIAAVLGWIFSPALLQALNCPADCYDGAVLYLQIYFAAAPAILLYNFCSAIISTAGNTQSPLYYMLASGVLNVVLNIFLCLILPNKVAAVAIATMASQILGAALCLLHLRRGEGNIQLKLRQMRWNNRACGKILSTGLPISVTSILFPIGNLQIQSAINSYGSAGIAGFHAENILETILCCCPNSISTAGGVFIGQNLGAQKPDRVKRTLFHNLWLNIAVGLVAGYFLVFTGRFWLGLLVAGDPAAIDYGMVKVYCIMPLYFIIAASTATSSFLNSLGYTFLNSTNNIIWVLGFRLIWMNFIYPIAPSFFLLIICFTFSWMLMSATNIVYTCFVYSRYRKGKYRRL